MKKDKETAKDELRAKYQRSDFPQGLVRGKYAKQMPEWQKRELDKRYQAYKSGEQNLHDWQSVHEKITQMDSFLPKSVKGPVLPGRTANDQLLNSIDTHPVQPFLRAGFKFRQ